MALVSRPLCWRFSASCATLARMIDRYPLRARRALERLMKALAPLAPEPSALVVYGSLAKGMYRDGESDLNLAVVLHEASPETLRALAEPLRAAQREARVEPFIVEAREVPRLADVFPVKLADIRDAWHVLAGEDPFGSITIDPEHMRLRVEQELRNHLLRLRRQAIVAGDDPRWFAKAIYASATSLAIDLGALLRVTGREVSGAATRTVMREAASAFDLDPKTLERLCDVKAGAAIDDPEALFARLLEVVARAAHAADTLEVGA